MKNLMQSYKNEMEHLPIRESFEEDTLAFLQNKSTCNARRKKLQIQQFGRIAAAVALVCMFGTVTVAVAAELNLPAIVRNLFADNISADKIENSEYQTFDASVFSKNINLASVGMVGDQNTHYLLLKADVPKSFTADFTDIDFGICSYKSNDQREMDFTYCTAEKLNDAGDIVQYMIRYEIPYATATYSYTNGQPISVEVSEIRLSTGTHWEVHTLSNLVLSVALRDEYLTAATVLEPKLHLTTGKRDVELSRIYLSEYKTIVDIAFPAEDFNDALTFWNLLTAKSSPNSRTRADAPDQIALYHNGSRVGVLSEYSNRCPGRVDKQDQFDDAGTYGCSLILEAIGYKEGDTLELHCGDQVLTIK